MPSWVAKGGPHAPLLDSRRLMSTEILQQAQRALFVLLVLGRGRVACAQALFVLELCIRMGAEKLHFFQGEERWWTHGLTFARCQRLVPPRMRGCDQCGLTDPSGTCLTLPGSQQPEIDSGEGLGKGWSPCLRATASRGCHLLFLTCVDCIAVTCPEPVHGPSTTQHSSEASRGNWLFGQVLVANSLAELAGPLANFSFLRILRVFRPAPGRALQPAPGAAGE